MYSGYTHSRSVSASPSACSRLRTCVGEGNGCSGEMWSPLALSPPRSVAPARDQLEPPVGQVGRDLDADVGHQPPRLGDQPLHVLDRHLARPGGASQLRPVARPRCASTRAPRRRRSGPARGRSSSGAGTKFWRITSWMWPWRACSSASCSSDGHPLLLGLADADQDPAGERDLQLAGGRDRLDPPRRMLGRRARRARCPSAARMTDSSISPCEAVTSRSRARSSRPSTPRLVCGSSPRSSARSQVHTTYEVKSSKPVLAPAARRLRR